jgi:hypoxanthine phosphoribosyltransferase
MTSSPGQIDPPCHADISRVFVPAEQIRTRVDALAGQIAAAYAGRELTLVMILTGAAVFVADLVRRLDGPVRIEPVSVSSYAGQATRAGQLTFRLPPQQDLAGRDVLLVDDIYDSGQTLEKLTTLINPMNPASLASCVLLNKNRPDLPHRPARPNWAGFEIPDEFVVGYGLDFDGLYRNLPYIGVLAEHARGGTS